VKLGAWMAQREDSMDVVEFARVVEQCGFESVWQGEHSHRPTSDEERRDLRAGRLHDYAYFWEQWTVLGAWSAATATVKLGTAISLIMQRDPIWLAKQSATVDRLSHGRLMLGIGVGHPNEPYATEMLNHGTNPSERYKVLRERVLAVREIWTREEAEFHGEYVDFGPMWSWPKPVQQPHPPVIFGSNGRTPQSWARTLQRLLEFCDGWMVPSNEPDLADKIAELRRQSTALGKPPYEVTVLWVGGGSALDERSIEGATQDGVDRIIYYMPSAGADATIPELERVGALAQRYQ
jgi:probable F420-dependent oxidoreductase